VPETPLFFVAADAGCSAVSMVINYDVKIYYNREIVSGYRLIEYSCLKNNASYVLLTMSLSQAKHLQKRGSSGMASRGPLLNHRSSLELIICVGSDIHLHAVLSQERHSFYIQLKQYHSIIGNQ
jgi:hypothetical protein